MTNKMERPLITFALFAYNQERFIREAVEGALSQTYFPLEVILSDDCSEDATFEIIKEMMKTYKGKHKVILNRNSKNLGIAGHINNVVRIAQGEWIVFASGDDISFPERTSIHYETVKNEHNIFYSGGGTIIIDENGIQYKTCGLDFFGIMRLTGCMAAYHKSCFQMFGELDSNICFEDHVLPYRALLLGKLKLINTPLVKYRCQTKDYFESYRKYSYFLKSLPYSFQQRKKDITLMIGKYSKETVEHLFNSADQYIYNLKPYHESDLVLNLYEASFLRRIKLIRSNSFLSTVRKAKLFLLSFKTIRIAYGKYLRYFKEKQSIPFDGQTLTVDLESVITGNVKIETF
ncbi:glycosyltransferase family 2 protein [Desulfatiglans anilini]|uniref:glycosyltransferase family 2 protein n=1 Tax=Desulfatiglans anilini TaxID=90728 RepID=UPI00137865EE|nr:glycosyltransferase [Desulfatiglans anilini]